MTRLVPLAAPAEGPVSLSALRTYLRVDGTDDDDVLTAVLRAARQSVEQRCGRILSVQTWRLILDAWPPDQSVVIPLIPFRRIVAARVHDGRGNSVSIPTNAISIIAQSEPALVSFANAPAPGIASSGIEIDIECGYAVNSDVPAALTLAVLRAAARFYEARGDEAVVLRDDAFEALIAPYCRRRLA